MNPTYLLILSIVILTFGALLSLILARFERASKQAAGMSALLGSLLAAGAAIYSISPGVGTGFVMFSLPTFGHLTLFIDSLSLLFVAIIGFIGVPISLFFLASSPTNPSIGFFTNLFMAAMLCVVTCQNTFFFIVFWEIMTLTSYFLIIWKTENQENIRTGYIYLLVAHAGAALIMLAIFLVYFHSNSFDFALMREFSIPPSIKNWGFLLAFIGFGAKAGMVPLHFWTPNTYALAPHHASAWMAGVMKKIAIYGILRFSLDLLGPPELWWGVFILGFAAASTIAGAFFALPEANIKRLLAYSSVEHVGIILLGVGLGVIGASLSQPILAALGLMAALYHIFNHAFFKSLLFLITGSVIDQTQTTDLNKMGGLRRHLPLTATFFFIGSIAVTAIPPLNGFVSEWFTYQAFFLASKNSLLIIRVLTPLFAILMAFAGAIAIMVYIKAYGSIFAGPERIKRTTSINDPPVLARLGHTLLAMGCIFLGVGSPWVSPLIAQVSARVLRGPAPSVAQGGTIFPETSTQAVFSPPFVAFLLICLLVVPVILIILLGGFRAGSRANVEPWSCGYGYSTRMSVTAASFYQPVKVNFQPIYWLRSITERPFETIRIFSLKLKEKIIVAEPLLETFVTRPATRLVETAGQWIQTLQMGDIRVYCLYIIVTLAILLIVIFGRSGL